MNIDEAVEVTLAVAQTLYNNQPIDVVEAMYGIDIHPNYAEEKARAFCNGGSGVSLTGIMAQLDVENQHRFVEWCLRRSKRMYLIDKDA